MERIGSRRLRLADAERRRLAVLGKEVGREGLARVLIQNITQPHGAPG